MKNNHYKIVKTGTGDGNYQGRNVIQVFVFKGEQYLGWDCFCKDEITIGSLDSTDLTLKDHEVLGHHITARAENGQVCVFPCMSKDGNSGTGREYKSFILGPLDCFNVGPYTLKIKTVANETDPKEIPGAVAVDESLAPADACIQNVAIPENNGAADSGIPCSTSQENKKEGSINYDHSPSSPGLEENDPVSFHRSFEPAEKRSETGIVSGINPSGPEGERSGCEEDTCYNLIFDGKIKKGSNHEEVKGNIQRFLQTDSSHINLLFSGKKVILKKNVDYRTVTALWDDLEKEGILCLIEQITGSRLPHGFKDGVKDRTGEIKSPAGAALREADSQENVILENLTEKPPAGSEVRIGTGTGKLPVNIDDEDDDDDDREADFSLKDVISSSGTTVPYQAGLIGNTPFLLEVMKTRNDGVLIDVGFLDQGQDYSIMTPDGGFRLAENSNSREMYFFFTRQTNGFIRAGHDFNKKIVELCSGENLVDKKTGIYRSLMPKDGFVSISHGPYEYRLRKATPGKSPRIKETPKQESAFAKHFGRSVILHVIILTLIGMFPSYKADTGPDDAGRFVQVDTKDISEIKKRIQPPQMPRKEPEIITQQEPRVAQKFEKKAAKENTRTASFNKKIVPAPSMPAGNPGGTGQGKPAVKNVSQTGILTMLGDNIGIKPQEAMAAVTNLDAVSSIPDSKAQFKVGGIVGKLEGGRIEVPRAGIVSTKGSAQVMKGSGAGGEGRIAALEKGNTGSSQVKAKVSAQLSKTVHIQGGGMSREEVKRIIDRHLEEITHCYETALVANPSLMGRVVFEWKILMSGRVGEVKIKSSTINSAEIHHCIQSAIKSWEFPQPQDSEVVVSYPFIFDIVGF